MGATIKETFALAYQNHQKNNFKVAEKLYNEILKINPHHFESIFLLGTLAAQSKKFDMAKQLLNKTIQINPNYVDAYNNLGNIQKELGEHEKAMSSYQKAIQLQSDFVAAYTNLGNALEESEPQKAISCYEKAIQINPNYVAAHYNFGNILRELGEHQKAINCYEKAINLKPNYVEAHNNILFTLLHVEKDSPNSYLSKAKRFRSSLKPISDHLLSRYQFNAKPKKLKIGFVSGDLRKHPVGFFLSDVLQHLKNKNLELIAYSNSLKKDNLSFKLKSHFINWREIANQNDIEVINQIRKDGIHILVDLSGHSAKNRLPIFINKPAPIQITWAGFLASTGITEIDYIVGDPHVMPSENKNHFIEKILCLPNIWCCFSVPEFEVEISELPAIKNKYITFGSFNSLSKINDGVIALWSKVLLSVPKSKIFLKTKGLGNSFTKKLIINKFKKNKINSDSIILEGASPRNELLATYNKIDIILDPFPYSGGTTSFESTWMGTPVLTKRGFRFISRSTESINHNSGMSDWIANNEKDYVTKAVKFSANLKQLSEIKKNLRRRALDSPLFNASLFAEQFKDTVWKIWNNFI